MRHATTLIAVLFLLPGCDYLTRHVPVWHPIPPGNLTAECPELAPAVVKDMGDLLGVCMDDAALYQECRARHAALAKWVKEE